MKKRPLVRKEQVRDTQDERGEEKDGKASGIEPVRADDRDGVKHHDNVQAHVNEADPGLQHKVGYFPDAHSYVSQHHQECHYAAEKGSHGQHTAGTVPRFSLQMPQISGANEAGCHLYGSSRQRQGKY